MNNTLILFLTLTGLLIASAGVAIYIWESIGDVPIGTWGLVAMAGGVIGSLALGIGLMRLAYKSERRGDGEED